MTKTHLINGYFKFKKIFFWPCEEENFGFSPKSDRLVEILYFLIFKGISQKSMLN